MPTSANDPYIFGKQRRWQHAKQRQGLCITCGRRPLETRSRCQVCRLKRSPTLRGTHA